MISCHASIVVFNTRNQLFVIKLSNILYVDETKNLVPPQGLRDDLHKQDCRGLYLDIAAIIIHRVPSFPILLVFVFLFETFLVANMLISIRRIKRSIEPRARHQSRGLAPVNLVDIEDEG